MRRNDERELIITINKIRYPTKRISPKNRIIAMQNFGSKIDAIKPKP